MNRLLLSLWLLGALLYAGNTLLYTNVIFGWPKQKLEADAGKETVKPKAEAPRPDRQPAEIAESQSTAQTTVEPQPAPAQPQGKHAPGLDIAAGAPPGQRRDRTAPADASRSARARKLSTTTSPIHAARAAR
jgi:hypothetical protein